MEEISQMQQKRSLVKCSKQGRRGEPTHAVGSEYHRWFGEEQGHIQELGWIL